MDHRNRLIDIRLSAVVNQKQNEEFLVGKCGTSTPTRKTNTKSKAESLGILLSQLAQTPRENAAPTVWKATRNHNGKKGNGNGTA